MLQDWDQQLSAENPFNQVNKVLMNILNIKQPVASIENVTYQGAKSVPGFREGLRMPSPKEEHDIVVATADCKGVVIKNGGSEKPIENHEKKRGPKPDRKKMAVVGSVYSIAPKVRTVEEVVASLFRDVDRKKDEKPKRKPFNKHVRASLTRTVDDVEINATEEVFSWLSAQVQQRDPQTEKPMVVIMDGQPSLWTALEDYGFNNERIEILDLLHATPRIWEAANILCKKEENKLKFIRERVTKLLQGDVKGLIKGLKQMGTLRKLSKKKKGELIKLCNYLNKNIDRMQYKDYLEKGYPIASGVIEGACRHYVKDRMERAGMKWTIEGAQAMLDIRSIYLNDQWGEFTQHRIKKEGERLYPHRQIVEQCKWPLTA